MLKESNEVSIFLKLYEEIKRDLNEVRTTAYLEIKTKKQINMIKEKILKLEREKVTEDLLPTRKEKILELKLKLKDKFLTISKKQMDEKEKQDTEIKNKIKIVSPDITDNNLKIAMRNPEQYLSTKILTNSSDTLILSSFEAVKITYEETLKLQQQMKDLKQMMIDFAELVEKDGQVLDTIEGQIINSVDSVDKGANELEEALRLKRELCKKRMCFACLFVVLIVIVAIAIFLGIYLQQS